MCDDRNTAAEQILKTIEYGLLPITEIERRLEQTLSEALAGPIGAEYDSVKAELCCSLLQRIYSGTAIDFEARAGAIKERIVGQYLAWKRRRKILLRGLGAAAVVLVMFVGLTVFGVLSPVKWFSGEPSEDGEQFIVTGHQIDSKTALAAIPTHEDIPYFESEHLHEMEAFLGFEIGFPRKLDEDFYPEIYRTVVSLNFLDIECEYSDESDQKITLNVIVYKDINKAYLPFEQEKESGKHITLNGKSVYTFTNINVVGFIWYSDNTVYFLNYDNSISNSLEITEQLLESWY